MVESDDKTPVISLECHKLMFCVAMWAAGKFAEVPEEEQLAWGAVFQLDPAQMLRASKEFAGLCQAFNADRNRIVAEYLARTGTRH